ncbi:MAG: carbohydrate-binding family 9-like protein [Verrucomicrobia bacterium]|nr:carbohydrate-binding family 9-like protein [Verrucomicrobiota bacterium]
MPSYIVRKTNLPEKLTCDWTAPAWQVADPLPINNFRPESGTHRPKTQARLLYDECGIHGIFQVEDRYVRCVRSGFQSEVWKDSCVEFFVKPKSDRGYFNFEFNCGGSLLCNYITNHERIFDGFKEFTKLPIDLGQAVRVVSSLPGTVEPEIQTPITWSLKFFIPFQVLESFIGNLDEVSGSRWEANFFKCADETSHPHWAAWAHVDELNFHLPRCFGTLRFET